jgi:hypothetical protein
VRVKGYGVTVPHLSSVPADLLAFFSQTHKEVVVTISPTATPHSEEVATVAAIVSVARVRVEGDEDTDIVVSIRLQLSINSNNGEIRASFYQTRPRKLRLYSSQGAASAANWKEEGLLTAWRARNSRLATRRAAGSILSRV